MFVCVCAETRAVLEMAKELLGLSAACDDTDAWEVVTEVCTYLYLCMQPSASLHICIYIGVEGTGCRAKRARGATISPSHFLVAISHKIGVSLCV